MMYSWGANSHGQLGIGSFEDQHVPTEVNFDSIPSIICGGGGCSIILTNSGIFAAGQISQSKSDSVTQFKLISCAEEFDNSVETITSGWNISILLTASGSLFALGSNSLNFSCQETAGVKWFDSWTRLSLPPMRAVSSGLRHVVAVSESGQVHYWARGNTVRNERLSSEVFVSSAKEDVGEVIGCSSGAYHSAILTASGHVGVWGDLRFGQGGPLATSSANRDSRHSLSPNINWISPQCFDFERVISVRSGWSHMLALTESGNIFSWGRCDFGQLGRESHDVGAEEPVLKFLKTDFSENCPSGRQQFDPKPSRIHFEEQTAEDKEILFRSIFTGSEHCLAVDSHSRLWSWGWNEHGMCGLAGSSEESASPFSPSDPLWCVRRPHLVRFPCKNPFPQIRCAGSGYGHSFAFVDCS